MTARPKPRRLLPGDYARRDQKSVTDYGLAAEYAAHYAELAARDIVVPEDEDITLVLYESETVIYDGTDVIYGGA